jgi:hypothetical protein
MIMMRKVFLWIGVAVVLGWSSGASSVPIQWTIAEGGNGHFYEVSITPGTTWDIARSSSLALGAGWDLASVTSQAEQDFITSLLPASPFERESLWVGTRYSVSQASWEWSNGDAFAYTNWWAGEPNSDLASHSYVLMDFRVAGPLAPSTGWAWNNATSVSHWSITGYVSESPIPEPSTALLLGIGLSTLAATRRKRARSADTDLSFSHEKETPTRHQPLPASASLF